METIIDLRIEKNVELLQAALLIAMPSARGALKAPEMMRDSVILASRAMEAGDTVWGWSADPRCCTTTSQWTANCPLGGRFFSRFYSIGD